MCELSRKRTGSRGCEADVGQGYPLEGVAIPPIVIPAAYGRLSPGEVCGENCPPGVLEVQNFHRCVLLAPVSPHRRRIVLCTVPEDRTFGYDCLEDQYTNR
jgi:hypothetical protein